MILIKLLENQEVNVMSKTIAPIIIDQIDALLTGEPHPIANLANAAALLYSEISDINWAGFYLYHSATDELILGPFQGKVACIHIQNGSGVCGTALKRQSTLRVDNVHEFPGHIACDSASNSEIVIPLMVEKQPIGVLDIDSPSLKRFSAADERVLNDFVDCLMKHIDKSVLRALN